MQEAHDGLLDLPEVGEGVEGDAEKSKDNDVVEESGVGVAVGGTLEHGQFEALLDVLDDSGVAVEGLAERGEGDGHGEPG